MRYYNQGDGYRVSYNEQDAARFSQRWPCSTVKGAGWFEFDSNGDLVDRGAGTKFQARQDGHDWLAFCEDCKEYGEARHQEYNRTHKQYRVGRLSRKAEYERVEQ